MASRSQCREDLFIFEPHTDLIKRGKVRTPVEFGHKVFLAESAKGLITQYEVLKGNQRTKFMWRRRSSATAARSAVPRNSMAQIAASSASKNVAACVQGAVKTVCIPSRRQQNAATPSLRKDRRRSSKAKRFRAGMMTDSFCTSSSSIENSEICFSEFSRHGDFSLRRQRLFA